MTSQIAVRRLVSSDGNSGQRPRSRPDSNFSQRTSRVRASRSRLDSDWLLMTRTNSPHPAPRKNARMAPLGGTSARRAKMATRSAKRKMVSWAPRATVSSVSAAASRSRLAPKRRNKHLRSFLGGAV